MWIKAMSGNFINLSQADAIVTMNALRSDGFEVVALFGSERRLVALVATREAGEELIDDIFRQLNLPFTSVANLVACLLHNTHKEANESGNVYISHDHGYTAARGVESECEIIEDEVIA